MANSFNFNLKMGLCAGRHEINEASDGYIFNYGINDITAIDKMEDVAFFQLWQKCNDMGATDYIYDDEGKVIIPNKVHLDLYVTGLTTALISVLNVCKQEKILVTLWHYNREENNYFPQVVR